MATLVASTSPSRPMSAMYAQETGRIQGLPHGAADTVPHGCSRRSGTTGWSGRKGARWGATQIGPIRSEERRVGKEGRSRGVGTSYDKRTRLRGEKHRRREDRTSIT